MSKIHKATKRAEICKRLRKINYAKRALPDIREFKVESFEPAPSLRRAKINKVYYVMRIESVAWECTCPDYRFRRRACKHIRRLSI